MTEEQRQKMLADGWEEVTDGKWVRRYGDASREQTSGKKLHGFVRKEQTFQAPGMEPITLSSNKDVRRDTVKRIMEKKYPDWCKTGYQIID